MVWQIFLVFTTSKGALGPYQTPIQCLPRALSLEKWLRPEADFSLPPSAKVMNMSNYTFTQYVPYSHIKL